VVMEAGQVPTCIAATERPRDLMGFSPLGHAVEVGLEMQLSGADPLGS
jgi:hypothetical protein